MAQESPNSVDVLDIQFKLHDKFTLFSPTTQLRSDVQLLAVACSQGLLFAGNPNVAEVKVLLLKELIEARLVGCVLRARVVMLPSVANLIACSADGSMLAINYTINGMTLLQIFSVPSFITPQIKSLFNIRLSPEDNVTVRQILWNPVITNNLAVVLSNGALEMYTLKEGGNLEIHSLGKEQQVSCGCWSPKGKQIVLGFPNGKLQQFKPDLTPAKTIVCPAGVHPGPFDTIALHWLSTFQFAAVFLQQGDEMSHSIYIVNAPKGGKPSYVNYYDVCYSGTGPRSQQVTFTHIQQWNLLLVTSANGVEVGILGTKESGETPTWVQYTPLDEARIEMPLTEAKDETYPIGFVFDTSSSHQLTIGETQLPVMPMVHVLSTYGHLVSFNFLNLMPGAASLCSPPPPIMDSSGQFSALEDTISAVTETKTQETIAAPPATTVAPTAAGATAGDTSFSFNPNSATSTPTTKEKPQLFGNAPQNVNPFTAGSGFAAPTFNPAAVGPNASAVVPLQFGNNASSSAPTVASFTGFGSNITQNAFSGKPADALAPSVGIAASSQPKPVTTSTQRDSELNKPLYTVPHNFTAPGPVAATGQAMQPEKSFSGAHKSFLSDSLEVDIIVKQMMAVKINAFDTELNQLRNQTTDLLANIGNPNELKTYTKRLNDLQEINEQADDREFDLDVQNLQHSLNESYAMLTECRTKLEMFKDPDITRLTSISTFDPINRRQLAKLQSYLATNQTQLQQLQQQIDVQWSNYQDLVRRNSKSLIHTPCLDGVYQRLTKLKDNLGCQRNKLDYIRSKLKEKGLTYKAPEHDDSNLSSPMPETTMESLADSILSMSMSHVVEAQTAKLSPEKVDAIRNIMQQREAVNIVKPQRPDRIGLKSEVIIETKMQNERKAREQAAQTLHLGQTEQHRPKSGAAAMTAMAAQEPFKVQSQLAKPTATKPILGSGQVKSPFTAPSTQMPMAAPNFNFGDSSPFVKTSAAQGMTRAEESMPKPFGMASSVGDNVFSGSGNAFASSGFAGFASTGGQQPTLSFGQTKLATATTLSTSAKADAAAKEPPTEPAAVHTPISFSAKVVGGDVTSMATTNKPFPASMSTNSFAALSANSASTAIAKPIVTTAVTGQQADKENKKPNPTTAAVTTSAFGDFAATTKHDSIFDGKSTLMDSGFNFGALSGALNAAAPTFGTFAANSSALAGNTVKLTTTTATPATTMASFSFSGVAAAPTNVFEKPENEVTVTTTSATPSLKSDALNLTIRPVTPTEETTAAAQASATTAAAAPATMPAAKAATTTTVSAVPVAPAGAAAVTAVTSSTDNTTDKLFSHFSICKPDTKGSAEAVAKKEAPANVFSGFGGGGGSGAFSFIAAANASTGADDNNGSKSIFGTSSFSTGGSSFGFGSVFGKSMLETVADPAKPTTTTTISGDSSVVSSATTTTTANKTGGATVTEVPTSLATSSASTAASTVPTSTPLAVGVATAAPPLLKSSSTPPAGIFSAAAAATTPPSVGSATPTASIFGGGASFLNAPTAAATTSNTAPLFGTSSVAAAPLFSANITTTAASSPLLGTTATASTPPTATPPAGNIFGGIPKPEQSVFGSPTGTSLFAAAAAANPSPFGSPPAANAAIGGNIFGGGATSFGSSPTSGGSIFGGGATAAGSPFGASAGNTTGGNIFGSSAPTAGGSGGTIFGQSAFGQSAQVSGGNIFGAAAAQSGTGTGFGSGGSIFGGANTNNAAAGGSLFGGGSTSFGTTGAPAPATGGFGSFASQSSAAPFGSPTAGASSFAQVGTSVAQSGFGSPQQTSAFAKPVFGGAPSFGSPPAFGAQPSFGGAPTFGSPKGFGSFTAPNQDSPVPNAFGSPTQKNNLFEALGSTDSGLSFGNLAQSTNANASKPAFGGSSFMNYRA